MNTTTGKLRIISLFTLTAALLPLTANAERYLVEFSSQQTFQSYNQQLSTQDELLNQFFNSPIQQGVQFMNSDAKVMDALDAVELVVVESDQELDIESIESHPSVTKVEKEFFIPLPDNVKSFGPYVASANIMNFKSSTNPWGIDAVKAPEAWEAADKGGNARVLVLDTGVDKDHPALASRFEKGRDFSNSSGLPYPFFDDQGHGTHVAGTVLADGVTTGLYGVAPEAKLLAGKVCAARGCSSIAIISGVNWAVEEGVDVVNMSLGGPFGSDFARKAYVAAEEADVLIVAAAGNDGVSRVGFPAAYKTTFAVGAINPDRTKADFSQWGPELDIMAPGVDVMSSVPQGTGSASTVLIDLGEGAVEVESSGMEGSAVTDDLVSGEIVYAGLGKPEDFTDIDVNDKVALIQRGEIAFGDKAREAIANGAKAVIIFNNEPGVMNGTLQGEVNVPVVMIDQEVGQNMVEKSAGLVVSASLGVLPSDYASFQGTSMASPHVAGVAALIRSANPELTSAEVKEIMRNTAVELDGENGQNQLGSGLIDAKAAVEAAMPAGCNDHVAAAAGF
jgi:serine protease